MSATPSLVFGLIMAGLLPAHAAGITFTPVIPKPGESVRVLSHSESVGATTSHTAEGRTTRGTLSRSRDHDLVWTFRTPAEDGTRRGMVKVNQLTTASKTVINGKEEATQTLSLIHI